MCKNKLNYSVALRQALESLWTDVGALSRNPLIKQLGLVDDGESDDFKRAMALLDVILEAGERIKENGIEGQHTFALLDSVYGLDREQRRVYELSASQFSHHKLNIRDGEMVDEFEHELNVAIEQLVDMWELAHLTKDM